MIRWQRSGARLGIWKENKWWNIMYFNEDMIVAVVITFTLSNCKITRKKEQSGLQQDDNEKKKKYGVNLSCLDCNYQCDDHIFI